MIHPFYFIIWYIFHCQSVETTNLKQRLEGLQAEVEGIQSRIVAVDTKAGTLISVKQSTEALLQTTQVIHSV